jgi:hypothetical protein
MRKWEALVCASLAAAVVLLYRKVTRLWWTFDDAYLIHIASVRRWTEYFTNGEVWRSMPQHLFTPLLTASYDSELSAFALNARRWYTVQLIELALAAIAIYFALRLWLAIAPALGGTLLFVAGVPLCSVVTELMLVHYIESITLAAIATILFVRGLRDGRAWLILLSSIVYLAAMLAKEIAVPLPLLLVALPDSDLRARIRALVPHGVALVVYAIWRYEMLHMLFGGYGWAVTSVTALIATLPWKVALAFGPAAAVMLAGIIWPLRSRRGVILFVIGGLIAVAPIAPVSSHMERRFAVAAWLWWCVAFSVGAARLRPRMMNAALGLALVAVVVNNRYEWKSVFATSLRMSDEARVFFDAGADTLVRAPAVPPAAMGELRWLKEEYNHRPGGTGWFYDDIYLCEHDVAAKHILQFDERTRSVNDVTPHIASIKSAYCGSIRRDAPVSADFHYRDETLRWRFGPYHDGTWRVILGGGIQAFDVPAEEAFRLGDLPGISMRVRYMSPEGWATYSPELTLDFVHHPDFAWHR